MKTIKIFKILPLIEFPNMTDTEIATEMANISRKFNYLISVGMAAYEVPSTSHNGICADAYLAEGIGFKDGDKIEMIDVLNRLEYSRRTREGIRANIIEYLKMTEEADVILIDMMTHSGIVTRYIDDYIHVFDTRHKVYSIPYIELIGT